jgi:transposase InsO family protein
VIRHSDQGSQYTSLDFGKRCKEMGVRPPMGSVGDAYDNAMAESFFASLECELIDRRSRTRGRSTRRRRCSAGARLPDLGLVQRLHRRRRAILLRAIGPSIERANQKSETR